MTKNNYTQKIVYYKHNPDFFLEEFYNIKLLPFQKIIRKIKKEKFIYPRYIHYSDLLYFFNNVYYQVKKKED